MLETIIDILKNFLILFGVALVGALVRYGLSYLQTKTKNERVKMVLEFAEQAVVLAERTNWVGPEKKQLAMEKLTQRLDENKLGKFFTVEQLDQYVEKAVLILNKENDKLSESTATYPTFYTAQDLDSVDEARNTIYTAAGWDPYADLLKD